MNKLLLGVIVATLIVGAFIAGQKSNMLYLPEKEMSPEAETQDIEPKQEMQAYMGTEALPGSVEILRVAEYTGPIGVGALRNPTALCYSETLPEGEVLRVSAALGIVPNSLIKVGIEGVAEAAALHINSEHERLDAVYLLIKKEAIEQQQITDNIEIRTTLLYPEGSYGGNDSVLIHPGAEHLNTECSE